MGVRIVWDNEALKNLLKHDAGINIALTKEAMRHCSRVNAWTEPWMHGPMREHPYTCEHRVLENTQAVVIHPVTKAGKGMAVKRGSLHW